MENLTNIYEFGKERLGYMCNTNFSNDNQKRIADVQIKLDKRLPGVLWLAPLESLHITLFDWIAPLIDYGKSKEELFQLIHADYDQAMIDTLKKYDPIKIKFNELEVSQNAVILKGQDSGEYEKIRNQLLERMDLLPGTKLPPKIIHTSIARYKNSVPIDEITSATKDIPVDINHLTSNFRLVKETLDPMLRFEVLKRYALESA